MTVYEQVSQLLGKLRSIAAKGPFSDRLVVISSYKDSLASCPPNVDDVNEALERALARKEWDIGLYLIFAGFYSPSEKYVPLLCAIVDSECKDAPIENALELLAELKSNDSVPSLCRAISYRFDFDPGLQIPIKALLALSNIPTKDSLDALISCASSRESIIREEAERLLQLRSE